MAETDEPSDESTLPEDQADYINDYIRRYGFAKAELARKLRIDPSSMSRILNRTAGVGMDKYLGLIRLLGLRIRLAPDGVADDFTQLEEDIRRALFEWSADVALLRKRYAGEGEEQAERLATREGRQVRRPARQRPKKAAGDRGSSGPPPS